MLLSKYFYLSQIAHIIYMEHTHNLQNNILRTTNAHTITTLSLNKKGKKYKRWNSIPLYFCVFSLFGSPPPHLSLSLWLSLPRTLCLAVVFVSSFWLNDLYETLFSVFFLFYSTAPNKCSSITRIHHGHRNYSDGKFVELIYFLTRCLALPFSLSFSCSPTSLLFP